jgi:hypothetical protein
MGKFCRSRVPKSLLEGLESVKVRTTETFRIIDLFVLYRVVSWCGVHCCVVLYCIIPCCIVMYCIVLHQIVLHCNVSYRTV